MRLCYARLEPQLVLLDTGDVWIHGGEGGPPQDERWIAKTGQCEPAGKGDRVPPPGAVIWDSTLQKLVPATSWPGAPSIGSLRLSDGTRIVASSERLADWGRFGVRPEADAGVLVKRGRRQATLALSKARSKPTLASVRDGRVAITGGCSIGVDFSGETEYAGEPDVDVIDSAGRSIAPCRPMQVARYRHAVIEIAPGRLLIVGGTRKNDSPINDIEVLDLS
jgi:hypothetical protein